MKKHNEGFLRLVDASKARIRETDIHTVVARLKAEDRSFTLVDVREDKEWAEGFIAGAIHIGKGVMERDIETLIPEKDRELILYCGGGFRSALAADVLQQMGYKRVASMDGGWHAWCAAGLPTSKPS
jgi:rhodanese-related sulfurtransferase